MSIKANVIVKGGGYSLAAADYEFYVLPQKGDHVVLFDGDLYIVLDILHIPYGIHNESAGITITVVGE